MSDYNELMSLVDALVNRYLDAKSKIAALESTNLTLNRQIASMDAEMAAMADKIKAAMDAPGGSTMGI